LRPGGRRLTSISGFGHFEPFDIEPYIVNNHWRRSRFASISSGELAACRGNIPVFNGSSDILAQ